MSIQFNKVHTNAEISTISQTPHDLIDLNGHIKSGGQCNCKFMNSIICFNNEKEREQGIETLNDAIYDYHKLKAEKWIPPKPIFKSTIKHHKSTSKSPSRSRSKSRSRSRSHASSKKYNNNNDRNRSNSPKPNTKSK